MNIDLVEKLRKVLAMTQSPVEHEAQTAATILQGLLTKHNLSMADLEQRGSTVAPSVEERAHDLGKAAFKWKLDLAEGIADLYYCAPIVNRKMKTVQFIGRPDNVEALLMLYGWVIDQIKAIATTARREHYDKTGEHIDPLRWQVGFGEGAVERLIARLHEMKARQQEDLSRNEFGDVTALALHHRSEASDFLEEKYGYRVDGQETKRDREWRERWRKRDEQRQREQEAKDTLKVQCEESGDMEPYYAMYSDERPEEIAKAKEANDKWLRDYEKRERRNAARRTGPAYRERKVDWEKEAQSERAQASGRASAGKVNLQPFIGNGGSGKSKGAIN